MKILEIWVTVHLIFIWSYVSSFGFNLFWKRRDVSIEISFRFVSGDYLLVTSVSFQSWWLFTISQLHLDLVANNWEAFCLFVCCLKNQSSRRKTKSCLARKRKFKAWSYISGRNHTCLRVRLIFLKWVFHSSSGFDSFVRKM